MRFKYPHRHEKVSISNGHLFVENKISNGSVNLYSVFIDSITGDHSELIDIMSEVSFMCPTDNGIMYGQLLNDRWYVCHMTCQGVVTELHCMTRYGDTQVLQAVDDDERIVVYTVHGTRQFMYLFLRGRSYPVITEHKLDKVILMYNDRIGLCDEDELYIYDHMNNIIHRVQVNWTDVNAPMLQLFDGRVLSVYDDKITIYSINGNDTVNLQIDGSFMICSIIQLYDGNLLITTSCDAYIVSVDSKLQAQIYCRLPPEIIQLYDGRIVMSMCTYHDLRIYASNGKLESVIKLDEYECLCQIIEGHRGTLVIVYTEYIDVISVLPAPPSFKNT